MPSYDYACERCGPFVARRALAQFDQPAPCPACGAPSRRALTVPAAGPQRRRAAPAEDAGYRRLRHGGACACCP
ncbi:zinc ribbon domain-containing protein [Variovorax sp. J31P179]|uniref:FmdB family zinc ribbon protein n=1 Tax=Variovorax sp. J31P179 TaxID=3053508 RepID=UPI00257648DA|nr:FmdB family zinc ribbon protein [Variovorax sp. J31P179]MDM0080890.1 zinc ribbon domain-containing protein [Variovorax sp. J31P179]HET7837003.1 FmdB family zinc ribbon protein [Variovorax sp.]